FAHRPQRRRFLDHDRQRRQLCSERPHLRPVYPTPTLGNQQHIGNLRRPDAGHDRRVLGAPVKQSPAFILRFVLEAPGHGNRHVEDECRHARPLSRSFLTARPRSLCPRLPMRSAAIAALAAPRSTTPAGTRRATARPCLVITTSSPPATRSRSAERVVLASNAPTVIMGTPTRIPTSLRHPQPMRKLARIPFGPRILGDGRLPAMSPVRCSATGSFLSPGSRRRGRARSVAHVAFELAFGPGQRLLQRLAVE